MGMMDLIFIFLIPAAARRKVKFLIVPHAFFIIFHFSKPGNVSTFPANKTLAVEPDCTHSHLAQYMRVTLPDNAPSDMDKVKLPALIANYI